MQRKTEALPVASLHYRRRVEPASSYAPNKHAHNSQLLTPTSLGWGGVGWGQQPTYRLQKNRERARGAPVGGAPRQRIALEAAQRTAGS